MLLAAALSQINLSSSLLIAATLIAVAILPSCLTPKVSHENAGCRSASLCHDHLCYRTQESSHFPAKCFRRNLSRHLSSVHNTPFEHFMGIWFLCVAGASAIYTLYPVMMQEVYGIGQELLSLTFAIAMGLSVFYTFRTVTWLIDLARRGFYGVFRECDWWPLSVFSSLKCFMVTDRSSWYY
jgi:hypothetical protein